VSTNLDRSVLDDLVSKSRLVQHNLTVDHFIDWLALNIEVKEFAPLDLCVEHIPDLVPGNGHGDRTEEDLLGNRPPRVNLGTTMEVDSVGGWRNLLHHQLGLLLGEGRGAGGETSPCYGRS